MKYPLIIAAVAILIVGGWYISNKTNNPTSPEAEKVEPLLTPKTEVDSSPATSSQPGTYVDYSDSVIAATNGTKILFFHASWCPQCRELDADIKAKTVPNGVTIIKTDYDTNQALRQKYGVTIQTTLVRIDDNGNLVEKYVAYESPTLAAVVANLL